MGSPVAEKVAAAAAASATRKKIVGFLAAVVFVVVAVVAAAYFIWSPPETRVATPAHVVGGADTGAGEGAGAGGGVGAGGGAGADGGASAGGVGADEDADALRREFKRLLKSFQSELEPALRRVSVAAWDAAAHDDIFSRKEKALRAFGAGNYSSAVHLLQGASEVAAEILRLAERSFRSSIEAAARALHANDVAVARASIARALLIKPDAAEALALRARIAVLPEVLRLLEAADAARIENDDALHRARLQEIVRLDAAREDLKERLRVLSERMIEREFTGYVAAGVDAVAKRDLAAATRSLRRAQEIHPAREEVALLERDVRRLARRVALQEHLRAAAAAVADDDWARAHRRFREAVAVDATADAVDGEKLAARVIAAHEEIASYLARPRRLSSPNVAAVAETALRATRDLHRASPSLARQAGMLERLVADYATPVPVLVRSDNRTEILVRGVGRIGKIGEKVVDLRPGAYTFEGKRQGYRSKLIRIEVAPRQRPPEVTLICDERLR